MEGKPVRPGLPEDRHIGQGVQQHQVHVKNLTALGPQGLYHLGAHAQVGDKVPIHDVNMDRFRLLDPPQLFPHGGKIRCQQRGRNHRHSHPILSSCCLYCTRGRCLFQSNSALFSLFDKERRFTGAFFYFPKIPPEWGKGPALRPPL